MEFTMDIMTDEMLMISFRDNRDFRLFSELIERYAKPALSIARSYMLEKEGAEDALQEAFLRIMNKSEHFHAGQPFAPWFYRILRNICIDMIRRKKIGSMLDIRLTDEWDVAIEDQSSDISANYRRLVEKLSSNEREVVMLKIAQDLSFEEIAKIVGCSVEAAKKRSQRGIERLRILARKANMSLQQTGTWN